jgi:hypothetical protein
MKACVEASALIKDVKVNANQCLGCGMDLGGGTLTELFKLTLP